MCYFFLRHGVLTSHGMSECLSDVLTRSNLFFETLLQRQTTLLKHTIIFTRRNNYQRWGPLGHGHVLPVTTPSVLSLVTTGTECWWRLGAFSDWLPSDHDVQLYALHHASHSTARRTATSQRPITYRYTREINTHAQLLYEG